MLEHILQRLRRVVMEIGRGVLDAPKRRYFEPVHIRRIAGNEHPAGIGRRHPKYATPVAAIAITAAVTAGLALWADFDRLSDLGNVAVFAQYLPTCLAVPVLRRLQPANPRAFRLPFGPAIPAAATVGCLLFLNGMKNEDLRFALLTLLGGLAVFAALRWSRLAVPDKAR